MPEHDTPSTASSAQTLLAFDYGLKKIGVALANT
ncbi:Holliday junction resolvase RuvX, partial [Providencia rettgeri]|nr:Holliday junction resolvase RuvX [Providencia rettgeri]